MFKERGYAIAELNNVLYRKLDPEETFPSPPAHCEIRRSSVAEAQVAGAIVESAFFPDGAPEAFGGLITPLYQMEAALAFVATIEGKPVACGTGVVIADHKVCALGGAGTLADYRDAACRPLCYSRAWPLQSRRDVNTPWWSRKEQPPRNVMRSGWASAWHTARSRSLSR